MRRLSQKYGLRLPRACLRSRISFPELSIRSCRCVTVVAELLPSTQLASPWVRWLGPARLNAIDAWQKTLHACAAQTRQGFLADLQALMPVLIAVGGKEAGDKVYKTIQDVGRWWP